MNLPRRIRLLGLFQGVELADTPEEAELELGGLWQRPQLPDPRELTFDPLSDPLDEPFPEERR